MTRKAAPGSGAPGRLSLTQRQCQGFTLIELLVVVAIIAILAAILFPVFSRAKARAQHSQCLSNLKQLATAWQMYADDNQGRACPSYYWLDGWMHSWDFSIGPGGAQLGLLGPYTRTGQLASCPSFTGQGWDRPYTGYAYNTSYIGGHTSRTGSSFTVIRPPAMLAEIQSPSDTAVFADAGFGNPPSAHNYLLAPSDRTTGTFRNGTVHFRHSGFASVAWADGSVRATNRMFRVSATAPHVGTLSHDDSAYDLE